MDLKGFFVVRSGKHGCPVRLGISENYKVECTHGVKRKGDKIGMNYTRAAVGWCAHAIVPFKLPVYKSNASFEPTRMSRVHKSETKQ